LILQGLRNGSSSWACNSRARLS